MVNTPAETQTAPGPAAGVRWDLSDLYAGPDDAGIDRDLDTATEDAQRFAEEYRGRLAGLSPEALARAVDTLEEIHECATRAAVYSQLLFAADTAAPRHGALLQHVQERCTELRTALLFFELEWVALDDAQATALLDAPPLAGRRHFLAALRRYRTHVLSEPEERVLEEKANTGARAFGRLFDELVADMRFRVSGPDGTTRELGEEEVLALLYHSDRGERRAAADALTEGLRANTRPLAFVFNTLVQDKAVDDRLRDYAQPIAARNLANEIENESVDVLLATCVRHYPLVARYYRLKARLLGLERLEDYDRYAPLSAAGALEGAARAPKGSTRCHRGAPKGLRDLQNLCHRALEKAFK